MTRWVTLPGNIDFHHNNRSDRLIFYFCDVKCNERRTILLLLYTLLMLLSDKIQLVYLNAYYFKAEIIFLSEICFLYLLIVDLIDFESVK